MATVLLSIKPKYVEKILDGTKRYEYRKVGFNTPVDKIVIYCTSPVKKVVGEAQVEEIITGSLDEVWSETHEYSGTTKEFLYEYYNGRKNAIALKLTNVKKYDVDKDLIEYNVLFAPQSFIYLD